MTFYEFVDLNTGESVEVEFPMGKAPDIGRAAVVEGRLLMRKASRPSVLVPEEGRCQSVQPPRWDRRWLDRGGACDPNTGELRFVDRNQQREYCSISQGEPGPAFVFNERATDEACLHPDNRPGTD
jgi:hypothetical protein